jgi:hypothetical protein
VEEWSYSSMNCGYGYTKNSAGYCEAQQWYETMLGCYETTIIQREYFYFAVLVGPRG